MLCGFQAVVWDIASNSKDKVGGDRDQKAYSSAQRSLSFCGFDRLKAKSCSVASAIALKERRESMVLNRTWTSALCCGLHWRCASHRVAWRTSLRSKIQPAALGSSEGTVRKLVCSSCFVGERLHREGLPRAERNIPKRDANNYSDANELKQPSSNQVISLQISQIASRLATGGCGMEAAGKGSACVIQPSQHTSSPLCITITI